MQVAIKSGAPQQSVAARGVHDHGYPGHAAKGTDDIPPVGPEPVQGHAPGERTGDKHTTVGGQDPTEMGVRLQCGEEPIDPKRNNSESRPKPTLLTGGQVQSSDVVITMGCGDACPYFPGVSYRNWKLPDPAGQPLDVVRMIRDDIADRVQALIAELLATAKTR